MAQVLSFSRCNCDPAELNGWQVGQLCIRNEYKRRTAVSSCSQLLCLQTCGCSVSLLWTACSKLVCRQQDSTLLRQRKKTRWKHNTVASGFGACHFPVDPGTARASRNLTLARPRHRALAMQIFVADPLRKTTQHSRNLRAHWPGGLLSTNSFSAWPQKAHL